ncbi:MAG TPA: hypothetical protein VMV69_08835 [Pirellulales bacterium]|nr:hypothetical protein [Pirellulales bacterium]
MTPEQSIVGLLTGPDSSADWDHLLGELECRGYTILAKRFRSMWHYLQRKPGHRGAHERLARLVRDLPDDMTSGRR